MMKGTLEEGNDKAPPTYIKRMQACAKAFIDTRSRSFIKWTRSFEVLSLGFGIVNNLDAG
jgi:hypothetical protein